MKILMKIAYWLGFTFAHIRSINWLVVLQTAVFWLIGMGTGLIGGTLLFDILDSLPMPWWLYVLSASVGAVVICGLTFILVCICKFLIECAVFRWGTKKNE